MNECESCEWIIELRRLREWMEDAWYDDGLSAAWKSETPTKHGGQNLVSDRQEEQRRARKDQPGVDVDLRSGPFLTTPLPIFFDMVVIVAWPLCTPLFTNFWTLFEAFELSRSLDCERLDTWRDGRWWW